MRARSFLSLMMGHMVRLFASFLYILVGYDI
jgi:hypothetical protein